MTAITELRGDQFEAGPGRRAQLTRALFDGGAGLPAKSWVPSGTARREGRA